MSGVTLCAVGGFCGVVRERQGRLSQTCQAFLGIPSAGNVGANPSTMPKTILQKWLS